LRPAEPSPTNVGSSLSPESPKIRKGCFIGGGLTAAVFFGLFYWSTTHTWTERVWHDFGWGLGYWETVTRSIDPAIQALFLIVAMVGLIAMVFGLASRR
jgi:hypothetical protein